MIVAFFTKVFVALGKAFRTFEERTPTVIASPPNSTVWALSAVGCAQLPTAFPCTRYKTSQCPAPTVPDLSQSMSWCIVTAAIEPVWEEDSVLCHCICYVVWFLCLLKFEKQSSSLNKRCGGVWKSMTLSSLEGSQVGVVTQSVLGQDKSTFLLSILLF